MFDLDEKKLPKWQGHSTNVRRSFKFRRDWMPWSDRSDIDMLGVSKQGRVQDLINVGWAVKLSKSTGQEDKVLRKGYFIDLSQSIDRKPWGDVGVFCGGSNLT